MYLGFDLGTSEIKAVVINNSGSIIATANEPLTVQRPHPHWSEQDPQQWWQATLKVVEQLMRKIPQQWPQIQAIGLSGQMHGAVLLDNNQQILRPAILWNDTRSDTQCKTLTDKAPQLHQITGNLAMPGFTAPKLLWISENEPEIFARINKVLLPKDYLRLRLTGAMVSDMSDAAGTLWLDVAKRDWSDAILDACGLNRSHMPSLVEGSEISALLRRELAAEWGLSSKVVVAGGGGDNAASAVGIGAIEPGDAFISLGTSGVIFAVNDTFRPNPKSAVHAFCHALPQRWHQMSVMLTAASALRWLCNLLGTKEAELIAQIEQLSDAALQHAPLFLPYLSGERTPHNSPSATGEFHRLTHDSDAASLGYAVLEGVSFGLLDGLNVLREAGTQINQCSLVGGGARSRFWAQLLADILQIRIVCHQGSEAGGALGAARLGLLACGGNLQSVCKKPPVTAVYEPNPDRSDTLQYRYQLFQQFYRQQVDSTHNQ
ncbi:xylulokinase [Celerinatantimonas diazotrophica]|uniref:Xylulose kinase n=1 Tax=Celerinatantimonas diazotrophica TaxID=412034 RepID=A0A4R1JLH3_9GAMM|nr:xylulokinase [Celerinatantimonas diazotrophica]TCK51886.1 xylulokinase [Celerinatantimonas diazotrophica]CAG9296421.1 Xylulose kinase [Celerinatantimonas diazotrophica]